MIPTLPMPPAEMRALVGPTAEAAFDNPTGAAIFPELPDHIYETVFDLGSGCGRLARQLLQQNHRPRGYLGIDLHAGMVGWCQRNLTSADPNFQFVHHDVYEPAFNPSGLPTDRSRPLPVADASASLIIAWSVFTHLVEDDLPYYLEQCARILRPGGVMRTTWFLFDKRYFPMMQPFQNCLYISSTYPTSAVVVDRTWLLATLASMGLTVASSTSPYVRGHQWSLDLRHAEPGEIPVITATDEAPFGSEAPPMPRAAPHRIGLDSSDAE